MTIYSSGTVRGELVENKEDDSITALAEQSCCVEGRVGGVSEELEI